VLLRSVVARAGIRTLIIVVECGIVASAILITISRTQIAVSSYILCFRFILSLQPHVSDIPPPYLALTRKGYGMWRHVLSP
jgi:hypothetical protein